VWPQKGFDTRRSLKRKFPKVYQIKVGPGLSIRVSRKQAIGHEDSYFWSLRGHTDLNTLTLRDLLIPHAMRTLLTSY
jgi:hypothetical protein